MYTLNKLRKKHKIPALISKLTINTIKLINKAFKDSASKAGKQNSNNEKFQFWQQDNHPIEIWSEDVILQKLDYLHNNPVVEGYVDKAEEYLYSSAKDYYFDKPCGLIDIIYITE